MSIAWTIVAGSQLEGQRVVVLGPSVDLQNRRSTQARFARNHVWVTVRNDSNVALLQSHRLGPDITHERDPAGAAGDDIILDCVLSARHDRRRDLRCWRGFRDPRRSGRDVKKDRTG